MNEQQNNPRTGRPASVELRSEAPQSAQSWKPLSGKGKWSKRKKIVLIVGTVGVLLLIGVGIFAGLRTSVRDALLPESRDGSGFFGDLPLSGLADKLASDESPLSGIKCEHHNRRPIGVMLAGDPINRPVSGFAKADMVFELPALVSGVTRLLAVYQCNEPGDIGSVRSARHDYLFLAEGVDAIVGHWGGSYHALNRIAAGEFQTLNALTNPHNAFFRKNNLPAPYNGFTTYERLWNALVNLGYRQTTELSEYEFKDDIPTEERPAGGTLSIAWPGAFRVHYEYDPATNRYQRFWAGVKQVDGEDNTTLVAPSSVVIMRATNEFADGPGGYNEVGIEGTGALEVYQDGKIITGTWRKDEKYKKDPVHFLNEAGEPIILTRGQIWIMAVEPTTTVTWEAAATSPAP